MSRRIITGYIIEGMVYFVSYEKANYKYVFLSPNLWDRTFVCLLITLIKKMSLFYTGYLGIWLIVNSSVISDVFLNAVNNIVK